MKRVLALIGEGTGPSVKIGHLKEPRLVLPEGAKASVEYDGRSEVDAFEGAGRHLLRSAMFARVTCAGFLGACLIVGD